MTVGELSRVLRNLEDDFIVKVQMPGGEFLDDIVDVRLVQSLHTEGGCEGLSEWVEVIVEAS